MTPDSPAHVRRTNPDAAADPDVGAAPDADPDLGAGVGLGRGGDADGRGDGGEGERQQASAFRHEFLFEWSTIQTHGWCRRFTKQSSGQDHERWRTAARDDGDPRRRGGLAVFCRRGLRWS
jgi:hypothetical protein